MYEAASERTRFVPVEGGSHFGTNALGQEAYREAVSSLFGVAGVR